MEQSTPTREPAAEPRRTVTVQALSKSVDVASTLVEESLRSVRAGLYLTSHTLEVVLPALVTLSEVREDITRSLQDTISGAKTPAEHVRHMSDRIVSGARYRSLVKTLGRELFGSATYAGESVLASNDVYRLVHLPPKPSVPPSDAAVFFLGGFIPYGDRLFRFLPEANFFDRYLERGISVYVMELVGDRFWMKGVGKVTIEQQIAWIDELTEVAFRHNGERKMIAQGYCGSGMQLLAWLAARPKIADARFSVASLFVTPVDAKRCRVFAETVANMPRSLLWTSFMRSQLTGGYMRGLELWAGLDVSLKNVYTKTPLGRFASGWKQPDYSKVEAIPDLSPRQRFELAAAYWISVDNARRFPLPIDLVRKAVHLYDKGVGADGRLGFDFEGRPVSLRDVVDQTGLRVVAFYGGQDKLVEEESGHVLKKLFGRRYTHVHHPSAGHVSYVCFPAQWGATHPRPFLPNPVDVLLEAYAA